MKITRLFGALYAFNPKTKELLCYNAKGIKILNQNDYAELKQAYKGANRIYKPIALLFWTDCINGKSSNYTLVDNPETLQAVSNLFKQNLTTK